MSAISDQGGLVRMRMVVLKGVGVRRLTPTKDPEEHCLWLPCAGLRLRPHVERKAVLAKRPPSLRFGGEDCLPCWSPDVSLVGRD